MNKLYREGAHIKLSDAIGSATEFAEVPLAGDSRWSKGVPKTSAEGLPFDILLLGPSAPSGNLTVSVARKGASARIDVNHPLLAGCVAWMPLYLLEGDWRPLYEGVVLPGVWEAIGDQRYAKFYNGGECRIEAHLYDGKVVLTGHLNGNVSGVMRASVQVGEFRIPCRAENEIEAVIALLERRFEEQLAHAAV